MLLLAVGWKSFVKEDKVRERLLFFCFTFTKTSSAFHCTLFQPNGVFFHVPLHLWIFFFLPAESLLFPSYLYIYESRTAESTAALKVLDHAWILKKRKHELVWRFWRNWMSGRKWDAHWLICTSVHHRSPMVTIFAAAFQFCDFKSDGVQLIFHPYHSWATQNMPFLVALKAGNVGSPLTEETKYYNFENATQEKMYQPPAATLQIYIMQKSSVLFFSANFNLKQMCFD